MVCQAFELCACARCCEAAEGPDRGMSPDFNTHAAQRCYTELKQAMLAQLSPVSAARSLALLLQQTPKNVSPPSEWGTAAVTHNRWW